MNKEIKEGNYYWYKSAYGKDWQIYKCVKNYFNENQNQWLGRFEIMTDTSYSNSLGVFNNLNEIEMKYYIDEISDVKAAFDSFKSHEKLNLD